MSVDKLVDSTQLDTDLTAVANAIRIKGGTSASLTFPSGFVSAINTISGGESGQTTTGTVTGDGTNVLEIPCNFAPDLIYIYGDMSEDVANRGIVSVTIIKDDLIDIHSDSSTSASQENLIYSAHNITGYNDASLPHASYSNGTLTIDTISDSSSIRFRSGQVYNYELSTIGTGGGDSGYTRTVIAEEQTVTPVSTSSGGSTYYNATLNISEGFETNAEYIITFNGTEYFFTCQVLWGTNFLLGDINYFYGGSDLPYPFGIMWTSGTTCTLARNNGNQVTVKIEKLELTGSGGGSINPLSGKILSATGDSIAAGAGNNGSGYPEIVTSDNNMTLQNIAVGGGTVAYVNANTFCISRSISSMRSDADFVLLEGGGNDADSGVPLGTLSSGYTATLDDTTFAGAIESMFKSALVRFPNKKIGYVFIHKCASLFDSRVSNSYYDMAKSACEKWGIPYLDLNTQVPPLNYITDLRTTYTANADGYHPNELGYRTFYVPKVTAFLSTMLTDNSLINKIVTENGTYNATDDSADGYSSVTVNVSSSSEPIYETIVPSQTINCTIALSNGAYGGYITSYTETTIEGQKYRVTFDGTEYDPLNATYYGTDYLCVGDANVEASASATLIYPFVVMLYSNSFYLGVKGSGTHTLQVDKIISDGSNDSANPLKGKIATFTGDSICAGAGYAGGYAKIIGEDYDMIIQNIGVSDGTVVKWQDKFCISESIADMRSDADYVILEGGGNDADWGPQYIPVGTLSSGYDATLDTTTFAGAFEQMLKSAIAKFPSAKIGYIFVHKCIAAFDAPSGAYHSMAISALEKWGIPYCDLNVMIPPLGYIDDLKNTYTRGDGIHPNEAGYRTFYAPKIAAFMQTMLTDKTLINKTVTTNGTYTASSDNADGYSSVTVNVPSSGITPTGSINITTNGTHDVTNYASAVVNVSSGGIETENIIPEQSINCTISVGNTYGGYINQYSERTQNGNYYLVTLNGTEYIARAFYTSATYLVLGDNRITQGTDYTYVMFPFAIINEGNAFYLLMQTSGAYTLKIDKILSWN